MAAAPRNQNQKERDVIWYQDVRGFLTDRDAVTEFIPQKHMTLVRQLNAAFRFALYFTVIVLVLRQDLRVLYVAICAAAITAAMYRQARSTDAARAELFSKLNVTGDGKCYKPTLQNPYMNVQLGDYVDFPNRPPACDINKRAVKERVEELVDSVTFADVDDIYHRRASDRQFYTTPSTTIPNDQQGFAEWLYRGPRTCKEDAVQCQAWR